MKLNITNALRGTSLAEYAVLAGIASVTVGASLIFLPAGLIVGGSSIAALSFMSLRAETGEDNDA